MRAVAGVKQSLLLRIQTVHGRVGVVGPVRWLVSALSVALVVVAATFVGTNLVTADPVPGASPITVTFNYNGATGGNTLVSETVTPGVSADSVLPIPTKSGFDFSGWFNMQSLLNGQRITTIGEGDAGELVAGFLPPELAQTLNLDLPLPPTCANGLATCVVGDTGPGGGLVFYIDSTSGLRYEMAPKNWGVSGAIDPTAKWITNAAKCYGSGSSTADQNCQRNNVYPETTSGAQTASTNAAEAIGMGSANTDAIIARMDAGNQLANAYAAGLASAYAGVDGLTTGWFLPSTDELNEMCKYSRNPESPPVKCTGSQNVAFAAGTYGFASANYWSSSQVAASEAWYQNFGSGQRFTGSKTNGSLSVRPVRAF